LKDPLAELEKAAERHYDRIRYCPDLPGEDREALGDIFLNLLLQRFKTKTWENLRKMIAELTPLHKTRAGRDLLEEGIERGIERGIEKGIEKGVERGIANLIRRMIAKGKSRAEITELTDLPLGEIEKFLKAEEE